ncbi:MAG: LysM peptidoglycan-binding domain-containing protein [Ignavibacteriales bacterium]|nr:LysM peptidoglycan-binding domain-containing protein [Ignavibacteriales bacterium]
MKIKNLFLVLFVFAVMVVSAQEKMTREQWEEAIKSNDAKIGSFQQEVKGLEAEVAKLKETSTKIIVTNCTEDMYKIVGATAADVDAYRKAVSELEGKIRRKEGPLADRQKDLDALRANSISALPEFFDKVQVQLPRMMENWAAEEAQAAMESKSKDASYTVVKGDCLWFIAKKKEHYGNGFAWPKIYQANKDQIKNPNLIYPKQIFKIPALSDDEKAKYEKLRHNYKPAPAK